MSGGGRLARETGRAVFGVDPAGYHSARLDYPAELYDLILDRAESEHLRAIAEIGPGTGLATQHLLPSASERYVAIEPDPALADYLRNAFSDDVFEVVKADFVAAPLEGQFDLIAAASVFHWLDPDAALARIRTLLRPGGRVAIWWNAYRNPGIGDPFADATMPLLDGIDLPPSESMRGHYSLDAELHVSRLRGAGLVDVEQRLFRRERMLSAVDVRALYSSYSFVRALPAERRTALLDSLASLVDDQFGGTAPNVVLTALYFASAPD
ncbi:MAG: class I SAM-dependent methyltransferase [Sphingomonas sp.]